MSIFNQEETVNKAQVLAKGFLKEANQTYDQDLKKSYDAVQRFWFRNRNEEGDPIAYKTESSTEPTGIDILVEQGADASTLLTIAYTRIEKIVEIATLIGIQGELVMGNLSPPYDLVWNEDGTIDADNSTIKEEYAEPAEPEEE